jgi:hypothetical protein
LGRGAKLIRVCAGARSVLFLVFLFHRDGFSIFHLRGKTYGNVFGWKLLMHCALRVLFCEKMMEKRLILTAGFKMERQGNRLGFKCETVNGFAFLKPGQAEA